MQFKQWLETFEDDEEGEEKANQYFSIGHGDFSDEHGFNPKYIVWAFINNDVRVGPTVKINQDTGDPIDDYTHGTKWGHGVTDQVYKGRYEPQTGRLSIVKPASSAMRPVPSFVMERLRKKFRKITQVFEF